MFSVLWVSSSHSSPYTYSLDVTQFGTSWSMDQVFEAQEVSINSVLYKYTTEKQTEADMTVSIYNEGVFRETDDWSGLPSGSIVKYVPLPLTQSSSFGEGGIEVEGEGTIHSTSVRYSYRVDSIAEVAEESTRYIPDIQPDIELYNALEDDALSSSKADIAYSDEEEEDDKEADKEKRMRALRAANAAIGNAMAVSQDMMMQAMTMAVNMDAYYATEIKGGVYAETTELLDSQLPENRNGLRNGLAQQILHTKMVGEQYKQGR